MAVVGDAFLIDSGAHKHLHVVIWGPGQVGWVANKDQMILASVTTIYPNIPHDPACVLQAGAHPFIKHASYVSYRHLRFDEPSHIDSMSAQGLFVAQATASKQLVQQVRAGLCNSRLADRRLKHLLGCP